MKADILNNLQFLERAILSNPIYDNSNRYFLTIEEAYETALKNELQFMKTKKELRVKNWMAEKLVSRYVVEVCINNHVLK